MRSLAVIFVFAIALIAKCSATSQWALVSGTSATTLIGVGASNKAQAVAGATQNGVGSYVNRFAGSTWSKTSAEGMLLMDAAITYDGKMTVATGFSTVTSTDGGISYQRASINGM